MGIVVVVEYWKCQVVVDDLMDKKPRENNPN